jgi:hypothetical protein
MTGLAGAQGAAKAPAGAGSAAPAAGAKDAKAGAAAGAKVDPKAGGAGAPAPKDAKAPVAPPAPFTPPKPPAEIAATVKAMGKTKTCKGSGMGPDMQQVEFTGTVTSKSDLDGWFIRQNINMTMGKGKGSWKMKMEQLTTWDAKLNKWRVVGASNDGATVVGTADMKDGKYEFVGDMTSSMGVAAFKDHGDMTDPKNIKWWGEMSMDKGKTWMKVYEQTCK